MRSHLFKRQGKSRKPDAVLFETLITNLEKRKRSLMEGRELQRLASRCAMNKEAAIEILKRRGWQPSASTNGRKIWRSPNFNLKITVNK
jgi:hypothetical protein